MGGVLQAALGVCRAAMERGKREAPTSGGVRASVRAWRDLTVPQRFFRHFYVIGVGSFLGAFLLARGAAAAPTVLCLALLAVHTARRLAETVFVQIFSPGMKWDDFHTDLAGVPVVLPFAAFVRLTHSRPELLPLRCFRQRGFPASRLRSSISKRSR